MAKLVKMNPTANVDPNEFDEFGNDHAAMQESRNRDAARKKEANKKNLKKSSSDKLGGKRKGVTRYLQYPKDVDQDGSGHYINFIFIVYKKYILGHLFNSSTLCKVRQLGFAIIPIFYSSV